jgi:hypothetical protein
VLTWDINAPVHDSRLDIDLPSRAQMCGSKLQAQVETGSVWRIWPLVSSSHHKIWKAGFSLHLAISSVSSALISTVRELYLSWRKVTIYGRGKTDCMLLFLSLMREEELYRIGGWVAVCLKATDTGQPDG